MTAADRKTVRLDHLLGVFSVGSGDWPWTEEYDNLIDQADTRKLLERIRVEGIRKPILLGNDGRVWDGHHRIVIAMHLGLDSVPVEFSGSPVVPEEPEGEHVFLESKGIMHVTFSGLGGDVGRVIITREAWKDLGESEVLAVSVLPVEQEED